MAAALTGDPAALMRLTAAIRQKLWRCFAVVGIDWLIGEQPVLDHRDTDANEESPHRINQIKRWQGQSVTQAAIVAMP